MKSAKRKQQLKEAWRRLYYKDIESSRKKSLAKYHARGKDKRMASLYDMSLEDYLKLMSTGCLVCNEQDKEKLCVDHDHNTGRIRGCLCRKCNSALGQLKESPTIATNLYNYMVNYCKGEKACH